MDKPFIAICNSYIDIVPGHVHLRELADVAKEAIREAGGIPFEFNTIGVDDGIAMGHIGMRYSLPSREVIADAAETVINAHWFDGVFYIPNCDKITPGMLLASVRTNVPAIFCSGGPMKAGLSAHGKRSLFLPFLKRLVPLKMAACHRKISLIWKPMRVQLVDLVLVCLQRIQ